MKTIFNEYIKIVLYLLIGLLLVMASYVIVINVNHYSSLLDNVTVSEADNDYKVYKSNVILLEEKINKLNNHKNSFEQVLNIMKKDGVFRLIPRTRLSYKDLYRLNDYFVEELINNSWVSGIQELDKDNKYQDIIMMLANNANYLNSVFTNNSLVLYDRTLDSKIEDNYQFILRNYMMYSKVILNLCDELGGHDG